MASFHWTSAELRFMRAIAIQIPFVAEEQIERCPLFADLTDESFDALCESGLVAEYPIEAHPLIPLEQPLFSWKPGDDDPTTDQFKALAEQLHNRWNEKPRVFNVFCPTEHLAAAYGSDNSGLPEPQHYTHDLHVAEMFIRRTGGQPQIARKWYGEMIFAKLGLVIRRMKDPDAFFLGGDGKATLIVECGGLYTHHHLKDLHEHCAWKAYSKAKDKGIAEYTQYAPGGTAYELW